MICRTRRTWDRRPYLSYHLWIRSRRRQEGVRERSGFLSFARYILRRGRFLNTVIVSFVISVEIIYRGNKLASTVKRPHSHYHLDISTTGWSHFDCLCGFHALDYPTQKFSTLGVSPGTRASRKIFQYNTAVESQPRPRWLCQHGHAI